MEYFNYNNNKVRYGTDSVVSQMNWLHGDKKSYCSQILWTRWRDAKRTSSSSTKILPRSEKSSVNSSEKRILRSRKGHWSCFRDVGVASSAGGFFFEFTRPFFFVLVVFTIFSIIAGFCKFCKWCTPTCRPFED